MTTPTTAREYTAHARSTDTFGRVLCNSRDQHLVVDGPVQNGCPGEAITPAELFLSGVAACGVELLQVIAREQAIPLTRAAVSITGTVDRAKQRREDVTVFNTVRLSFELAGVSQEQGGALIDQFRHR
jgi:uncharacterized OsmC-like protein